MNFLLIIPYYLSWHYSQGILDYFKVWKNLVWFLWNFFSFKVLLKTFFSPFKRLKEKYAGGLDMESLASSILITTLMRLVGMVFRAAIIVFGLIVLVTFVIAGLIGIFVWLVLPFALVGLIIISLIALIK
jgi:fatty acid desaturase